MIERSAFTRAVKDSVPDGRFRVAWSAYSSRGTIDLQRATAHDFTTLKDAEAYRNRLRHRFGYQVASYIIDREKEAV